MSEKLVIAIRDDTIDYKFETRIYQLLTKKNMVFFSGTTTDIPRLNEIKNIILSKHSDKKIIIFSKYSFPILTNFITELRLHGINIKQYSFKKWSEVVTYYKEHVE